MSKVRYYRAVRGDWIMGSIKVVYKIFPEELVDSFDDLKMKVESCLPAFSSVEGYGEEPIAFGLKALLVQIKFPEDETGVVDEFETELGKIEGVSQVQSVIVRRTSR